MAPSTITRWLHDDHTPRAPEALAVLRALGAPAPDQMELLVLLDTPAALSAARSQARPFFGLDASLLPGCGDLWRAMRERRQVTADHVAHLLRVSPSTVSRWEGGASRVPADHAIRMCDLLGAYDEERAWLCSDHVFLPDPLCGSDRSSDSWEHQVRAIQAACNAWSGGPFDLMLLSTISALWPRACAGGPLADLMVEALVIRAGYLTDHRRAHAGATTGAAAYRLAQRLHWSGRRLARPNWAFAHALAGCGDQRSAISVRREVVDRDGPAEQAALQCLDIGRYLVDRGDNEAAEAWLRRSELAYRAIGDAGGVSNARWQRGSALVGMGRGAEAMRVLPEPDASSPNFEFHHHITWADACRVVGDPGAAAQHLDACDRVIEAHPGLACHRDAVTYSRRLLG